MSVLDCFYNIEMALEKDIIHYRNDIVQQFKTDLKYRNDIKCVVKILTFLYNCRKSLKYTT